MEISPEVQAKLDQIARLPRQVRIGLLFAVGLGIAGGYYTWFYRDAQANLVKLHASEQELQRKLSEVRSVAANIKAFEGEVEALELELNEALRQLPNQKELEILLTDISNLGKTAGVEIKSFRRNDEVVHDFYAEVPIDIELEGRYHDIARFFDLMSKLPRIVNMGSLKIDVVRESAESTRLKVSGTATTFRFVGNDKRA